MPPAKRAAGLSSAGTLVLVVAGSVLVARGSAPYGWWLVALGLANLAVPAAVLIREQRRVRSAAPQWPGGARAPGQDQANTLSGKARDATARRWTGAAHVPSAMGYVDATKPLGVLEVAPEWIGLRVRPAFVRAIFGIETLDVTTGQDVVVFPVRRSMGLEGIEIRAPGGRSFYFFDNDRSAVLAAVAAAGFEVSGQEQKMKLH